MRELGSTFKMTLARVRRDASQGSHAGHFLVDTLFSNIPTRTPRAPGDRKSATVTRFVGATHRFAGQVPIASRLRPPTTGYLRPLQTRRICMNDLLAFAINAHGGLGRWNRFTKVKAGLSIDGAIWYAKQLPRILVDKVFEVATREQHVAVGCGSKGRTAPFWRAVTTQSMRSPAKQPSLPGTSSMQALWSKRSSPGGRTAKPGAAGANYTSDYRDFQGIKMPTKRRIYPRDADIQKAPEPLVSIDFRSLTFS